MHGKFHKDTQNKGEERGTTREKQEEEKIENNYEIEYWKMRVKRRKKSEWSKPIFK